jgi:hypothetical protein
MEMMNTETYNLFNCSLSLLPRRGHFSRAQARKKLSTLKVIFVLQRRFHSNPWSAFGICIYEKSVSFFRPNPKFGAKLAIILENEHFLPGLRVFNASLFLTLNVEPPGPDLTLRCSII